MYIVYININSKEVILDKKYNGVNINKETKAFQEDIGNLSAWVVDWDLNSNKEILVLDNKLKNISYFAANFNSNNELTMSEELITYYNETKNYSYNKYITIVNDKINQDGSSLLKDANLINTLLSNSKLRSSHIRDIINLAHKYGFDGIEVDYENMENDTKLWKNYILFINQLYETCKKEGLKLRVVLEPSAPVDKFAFKEGPTYVMMCYNLHGGFSKPGEKANPKFISDLINKMNKVPGKKDFAISTGGFDWSSNGKTNSITEVEANILLKEHNVKAKRDTESKCLKFTYKDQDGVTHEVWYADKSTIRSWSKVIADKGYDISIWRLGGNLFE